MAPLYDGHDYYKKMFELQEKLRKSEEERIRLEERFNVLARESRNRHDVCINRLRMRYIQYLEEQRTRDERNHKLLSALDKVTNKLALISAKKDRLNVLRKQYEAYLLRVYANRRPPGSITGDSGIASQEDRGSRKTIATTRPDLAATETRDVSSPRTHRAPLQSNQSRSIPASKFHDQSPVNSTLLNNPTLLQTTPLDTPLGVDYHQPSVLRTPRVYVSPVSQSGEQLAQVPAIPTADIRQHSRTIPDYGGNAPGDLQDVENLRKFSYTHSTAPALVMPFSEPFPIDATLVNQLLRQHMGSLHAAPGQSTSAQFPAGDAAQSETVLSHPPRQFDPSTFVQPFQYGVANVLLPDQQVRTREHVPSDFRAATFAAAKPDAYPTSMIPETNIVNQVRPLPGYMDYTLRSPQKSEDEGSITRSLTSDDMDDLIKRNHLLWGNADIVKSPRRMSAVLAASNANLEENGRTTAILENELDRYISNIRKLHREHGVPSQEELDHEQNTSGDLLNVTLSEDAQELPAEDKVRKERIPEEMGRILALASDLASRTTDSRDIAYPAERDGSDVPAEIEDQVRHRTDKRSDAPTVEEERDVFADGSERHDTAAFTTGNEIREDVATPTTKLEQPHEDTRTARENWNNDDLAESSAKDDGVAREETTVSSSSGLPDDDLKNVAREKQLDLVTGEELNVDGIFDTVEELAPWDLASVQKSVYELRSDDPDKERAIEQQVEETTNDGIAEIIASETSRVIEQSNVNGEDKDSHLPRDTFPPSETKRSSENETESHEKNETDVRVEEAEVSGILSGDQHQGSETDEPAVTVRSTIEKLDEAQDEGDSEEQGDETSKVQVDDQAENARQEKYNVEPGYVEDPNQVQQYEEPSGHYGYDQNVPYESASHEEYERYGEQRYAQEGQEYVEYVDSQYEQYAGDPNDQQQYQHDPNAQYEQDPNSQQQYHHDPNVQYEQNPNQAYDYGYDQQYEPGQGYEGDPNQTYEYTEHAYDPDQRYDGAYEQEYKAEQQNPEDNVVIDENAGREEQSETEGASLQKQQELQLEQKADEDKAQRTDGVEGTAQSKKKKDVIKSLLDSDTDTTIERNVSNTESDFDFN
ncbi:uncharacterized protein LOC105180669 [Harpegnathos saltator]|uniref:uncharacterized protein LOC105180669 n=1 Tax=Harpegnathos saltator TaxID=610380 RepID=UPI00058D5530|nr:uncharacterized protein LOC105180669 [Harpegnathos saltator]